MWFPLCFLLEVLIFVPSFVTPQSTIAQGFTGRWGASPFPQAHQYHACHPMRDPHLTVCFGGYTRADSDTVSKPTNDLYIFDSTNLTNPSWMTPNPYGNPPTGRFCMATYYDRNTNRLFVHGGDQDTSQYISQPYTIDDGLWILYLDNMTWINYPTNIPLVNQPNVAPLARAGHAMLMIQNELWISGGYLTGSSVVTSPTRFGAKIPLSDIWRLNLNTLTWSYQGQMGAQLYRHKMILDTIDRQTLWAKSDFSLPPPLGSGSSPIIMISGGVTNTTYTQLAPNNPQLSFFLLDPNTQPPAGATSNNVGWWAIPSPWTQQNFHINSCGATVLVCSFFFWQDVVWGITLDQRMAYIPTYVYPASKLLIANLTTWTFSMTPIAAQPITTASSTSDPSPKLSPFTSSQHQVVFQTNGYSMTPLANSGPVSSPIFMIFGRDNDPSNITTDSVYVLFNTVSLNWIQPSNITQLNVPRWGMTATRVGRQIYTFGGHLWYYDPTHKPIASAAFDTHDVDLYVWNKPISNGIAPAARGCHFAAALSNGRDILIYGGYAVLPALMAFNDVNVYNTSTGAWYQPSIHGQPPARSPMNESYMGPTYAVMMNDILIHLHGADPTDEINTNSLTNVSLLDTNTWTWTHNVTTNVPNMILSDYTITYALGKIWLLGGLINGAQPQQAPLYVLDVSTWTWSSNIIPSGDTFSGRFGHSSVYITNGRYHVIYMSLGKTDTASPNLVLDLDSISLRAINTHPGGFYSQQPVQLYTNVATPGIIDGKILQYGGLFYVFGSDTHPNLYPMPRVAVLWTGFQTSVVNWNNGSDISCVGARSPCHSVAWSLRQFSRASIGTYYHDLVYPVDVYVYPAVITEPITVTWQAGIHSTTSLSLPITSQLIPSTTISTYVPSSPIFVSPILLLLNTNVPTQMVYLGGLTIANTTLTIQNSNSIISNCMIYNQSNHGMYVTQHSNVSVISSLITNNIGAGIMIEYSTVSASNNYISYNNHGIWATSLSTLYIDATTIMYNIDNIMGAGIYATTTIVTISNSNIINNTIINTDGESISFQSGGAGIALTSSTGTIRNTNIINNQLYVTSYAEDQLTSRSITSMGGGILAVYSTITMDSCIISNNNGERSSGGGCGISFSTTTLRNNSINNNVATFSGGGMHIHGSSLSSYSNTWSYNSATQGDGGALHLENTPCSMNEQASNFQYNMASGAGGAIFWWPQRPNTTINANQTTTNAASYGPLIATPASTLSCINNTALTYHITSGQLITPPLMLALMDTYQQHVNNDNNSVVSALPSNVFQGTLFQPAEQGVYVMSGLATRASPNTVNTVRFSVTTSYITVTTAPLSLTTRACNPGEYVDHTVQQCRVCGIGSYSNITSATICTSCDAGTYQPTTGSTSCLPCAVGMEQIGSGATTCTQCDAGRYSNTNGTIKCGDCPAGSFNPLTGRSICQLCSAGTATNQTGQVACIPCNAGYAASGNGTQACSPCDIGTYQMLPGQTSCSACSNGTYVSQSGQSSCLQCDSGRYSPSSGASTCTACWAGSYQPLRGQVTCQPCGVGTASSSSPAVQCTLCSPGSWQNQTGQTTCVSCNAGTYQPLKGQVTCQPCEVGTASGTQAAVQCVPCSAGSWQNQTGQSTCVSCSAGSYQPLSGQVACQPCEAGSATNQPGQIQCTPCAPGYVSPANGSLVCTPCDAGTYQPLKGQLTCQSCHAGTATNQTGQMQCTQCPAGYASAGDGSVECTACGIGMFQSLKGQVTCQPCAAGTASTTMAAVACVPCTQGSWQNQTGRSTCQDCQSGTYQDRAGQTSCLLCLTGQTSYPRSTACVSCAANLVAPVPGSASCTSCPTLSVPSGDHTRCECGVGSYGQILYVNDSAGNRVATVDCRTCPTGAMCNTVGMMEASLLPQTGYWRTNGSLTFYQCLTRDTCVGSGMGDVGCAMYRTGPICALCLPGYSAISSSAQCTSCPSTTTSVSLALLFSILILIALVLMYYSLIRADHIYLTMLQIKYEATQHTSKIATARTQQVWKGLNMDMANLTVKDAEQKTDGAAQETFHDFIEAMVDRMKILTPEDRVPYTFTIAMKILLGFFQILTNVTFLSNLTFPSTFVSFINVFSFINLDSIPFQTVQCITDLSFYNRMIIVTLVPPILFVALVLFYLLPNYIWARRDMSDDEERHARYRQHRAQFWKLCAFTLFLVYPSICNHVLSMFACRDVGGISYVQADFSLQCYDSEWNRYLPYGILMILVYPVGVPLLLFILLAYHRHELENKYVRLSCGFLYEAYHSNVWWFEIVDLLHKVLLSSLLVFVPQERQMIVAMCVVMFYAGIILIQQPYIRHSDDGLHMLAQTELYLIFLFAFILQNTTLDAWGEMFLSIILIILTVSMVLIFLLHTIFATRRVIRTRQRTEKRKSMSTYMETHRESSINHPTLSPHRFNSVTGPKILTNNIEMLSIYHKKSITREPDVQAKRSSTPSTPSVQPSPQLHGTTISSFGAMSSPSDISSTRRLYRAPSSPRMDLYHNPYLPPKHGNETYDMNSMKNRGTSTTPTLASIVTAPMSPSKLTVTIPTSSSQPITTDDIDVHEAKWVGNPLSQDDEDITSTGLYSSVVTSPGNSVRSGSESPRAQSRGTMKPAAARDIFARHRRQDSGTSSSLDSHAHDATSDGASTLGTSTLEP